jgi:YVTN family beta-propeller protein
MKKMPRRMVRVATLVILGASAIMKAQQIAPAGESPAGSTATADRPRVNPLRVATKQWFPGISANITFPVGGAPVAGAVDNTGHVWISNGGSSSVTKMLPDGSIVATYPVAANTDLAGSPQHSTVWYLAQHSGNHIWRANAPAGTPVPAGIAFAGDSMWIADYGRGVAVQMSMSGTVLQSVPVGLNPFAIAFNGSQVWVANENSNTVTVINASTGAVAATYATGVAPVGIECDGVHMWIANSDSNTVVEMNSDGSTVATFSVADPTSGLAWDGARMWASSFGGSVVGLGPTDATTLGPIAVGAGAQGIAYNGLEWVYVAGLQANNVTVVRVTDGRVMAILPVGSEPVGVIFTGINMLVTNSLGNCVSLL